MVVSELSSKFCYVFLTAPRQQVELQDHYCTQSILQPVWKPWILILARGPIITFHLFLKFLNLFKFTYLKVFLVQKKIPCFLFHLFSDLPLQKDTRTKGILPMFFYDLHRG